MGGVKRVSLTPVAHSARWLTSSDEWSVGPGWR
jgi:hypothetical protein